MTIGEWFNSIINNVVNMIVWPVFVAVVVVMFMWAGFLFLTARGEPGKIKDAQKAVLWAVVGVLVGLISFSAIKIINSFIPKPPV